MDYSLDPDEWFYHKLPLDESSHFFEPLSSSNFNNIEKEDLNKIKLLCILEGEHFRAKKVVPSFFMRDRLFFDFTTNMKVEQKENILSIDSKGIDFCFDKKSSKLFFKNTTTQSYFFHRLSIYIERPMTKR